MLFRSAGPKHHPNWMFAKGKRINISVPTKYLATIDEHLTLQAKETESNLLIRIGLWSTVMVRNRANLRVVCRMVYSPDAWSP